MQIKEREFLNKLFYIFYIISAIDIIETSILWKHEGNPILKYLIDSNGNVLLQLIGLNAFVVTIIYFIFMKDEENFIIKRNTLIIMNIIRLSVIIWNLIFMMNL